MWDKICSRAYAIRWRIAAILSRIAPAEMCHAALLLGVDFALGHGREGFLGHLQEFSVGLRDRQRAALRR